MLKVMVSLVGVLLYSTVSLAIPPAPDEALTPGEICDTQNPDFHEYRYSEGIAYCRRNVSRHVKSQIYQQYGIPERCRTRYTIDHLIPLSIGGTNGRGNLWPEHRLIKETRPDLEIQVFEALRDGDITQKQAIERVLQEKTRPRLLPAKSDCDRNAALQLQ